MTRGAVAAEGVEGGFSATYRILSVFEESGQARRGYVVEGLGAAQFAMDGAVDRLRAVANARDRGDELPTPNPTDNDPYGFGTLGDSTSRMTGSGNDSAADHGRHGTSGSPESTTSPTPSARSPTSTTSTAWAQRTAASRTRALPRPGTTALRPPTPGPGRLRLPRDFPAPGTPGQHQFPYANHRTHRPSLVTRAVVLAAADPANAYGAALPWPEPPTGAGHKPGARRARWSCWSRVS